MKSLRQVWAAAQRLPSSSKAVLDSGKEKNQRQGARSEEGSLRDEIPQAGFILFSNSTGTSTRAFSILASGHFTGRSAATPRSIPVSQNEKFASYLVPFSFENSITAAACVAFGRVAARVEKHLRFGQTCVTIKRKIECKERVVWQIAKKYSCLNRRQCPKR